MKTYRLQTSCVLLGAVLLLSACTRNKGYEQTEKNVVAQSTDATETPAVTTSGEERLYTFAIANFNAKSSFTFEVMLDGRLIHSVDVEALDRPSTSPGFADFPLRLPEKIGSLAIQVNGENVVESAPIDFAKGKFISIVFDNEYFTKKSGKRLLLEQRMTEPVYD